MSAWHDFGRIEMELAPRFERRTIPLKFGPYDFGEITLQALVSSLDPRFHAFETSFEDWIFVWALFVPCRDTGRPTQVRNSEVANKFLLEELKREVFIERHVYRPLASLLMHELDESLLMGKEFFKDPHP